MQGRAERGGQCADESSAHQPSTTYCLKPLPGASRSSAVSSFSATADTQACRQRGWAMGYGEAGGRCRMHAWRVPSWPARLPPLPLHTWSSRVKPRCVSLPTTSTPWLPTGWISAAWQLAGR